MPHEPEAGEVREPHEARQANAAHEANAANAAHEANAANAAHEANAANAAGAAAVFADVAAMLHALVADAGTALFRPDGTLVAAAGRWPAEQTAAVAQAVRGSAAVDAAPQRLADGRAVYWAAARAEPAIEPMVLALAAGAGAGAGAAAGGSASGNASERTAAAVAAAAAVLSTALRLNRELDGMTQELADRYEELNLIYATNTQPSRSAEGNAGLDGLVASCAAHLDAALVALLFPQQGLVFERHDERNPVRDLDGFLATVGGRFFADFSAVGKPIVCNDDLAAAGELARFGAMKIALLPVCNARLAICGVLLMANRADAPDFSNSDRNLLASLAERAAKIIDVTYDALTGLLRREAFEQRVETELEGPRRTAQAHCMLSIAVDELRVVNDTLGRDAGDEVLRCVAQHLEHFEGEPRLLGRLGADAFAMLVSDCPLEGGRELAERIRSSIGAIRLEVRSQTVAVTVSIGLAGVEDPGESAAALRAAELAAAAARDSGRDSVHVYEDSAASLIKRTEQMRWVGRIHDALRDDHFRLYGQLIQPLAEGARPHMEVLLRMLDDDGKVRGPAEFLPAAERYFLMPSIDRWVVEHALALIGKANVPYAPVWSINLSGQTIGDPAFIDFVIEHLARNGLAGDSICFEITETVAIKSLDGARAYMLRLKELGCRFSLDDFGAGLSSFTYLKALPVDYVKIDGSFVRGIVDEPVSESMVVAITQVGQAMGLEVVAEYVENAEIMRRLERIGVDYVQGYGVQPPLPLETHVEALTPLRLALSG